MQHIGVVLGADRFRPAALDSPVGDIRRPGRGENFGILDGDLNLQPLGVIGIDGRDPGWAIDADSSVSATLNMPRRW